ncbi:MAG: hypothetical protein H0U65_10965 [Rubrobacter sp.]|nr:hypothetical protein [Rubrobacter sp.]
MLEQLYTPKVIVALMVVILTANGLLLYQLWYEPSTVQTADTPASENPESPATPPDSEDEATEEDGDETEEEAPAEEDEEDTESESSSGDDSAAPPDEPEGQAAEGAGGGDGSSQGGQPSDAGPPGEAPGGSPETPFNSQYDPPPTDPGSPGGGSDFATADFDPGTSGGGQPEGELSRIQTAFISAFFGDDGDDSGEPGDGGSEVDVLPVTSGFGVFPAFMALAAAVGAALVIIRRK